MKVRPVGRSRVSSQLGAACVGLGVAASVAIGVWWRAADLGTYGFWNDEAWVAITTRVPLGSPFWLSLGPTPPGFALLLRVVPDGMAAESGLRAIPFLFGCATLWIAWRLGRGLGGPIGGLLAVATIAFDPLEIAFAKELKQYTAEAFFAVLAFERLSAATRTPTAARIWSLAAAVCAGTAFTNTQVLIAPAVLTALLVTVFARHDRRSASHAIAASTVAGLWIVLWFAVVTAPRVNPAMTNFFQTGFVPRDSLITAGRYLANEVAQYLGDMLGGRGWIAGLVVLGACSILRPAFRPIGIATVLLASELVVGGLAHRVPVGAPRVVLFFYATIGALVGAALGDVMRVAAVHRRTLVLAVPVLAILVVDAASRHDWTHITNPPRVEDVGPLIRIVERDRRPEDVVLVFGRSAYGYAYYQRATPLLDPVPNSLGWFPRFPDRHVRLIDRSSLAREADRAFEDAPVVWFVGSRLGDDAESIEAKLVGRATPTRRETRRDALLLRLTTKPTPR